LRAFRRFDLCLCRGFADFFAGLDAASPDSGGLPPAWSSLPGESNVGAALNEP
jgi:hypothetical protein